MANVGLVGDYDASVLAHQAIPLALRLAAEELKVAVDFEWVPTNEILGPERIAHFDAVWCMPASAYRNVDGAVLAIRYARENRRPFLGTCGGFQLAIVEYARNVLGWADAEHAETAPGSTRAVITLLECPLIETRDVVHLRSGSRIAAAYGCAEVAEEYRCRYGLNPRFLAQLTAGPLRVAAEDRSEEVRAIELDDHPFFVATLFQPERAALAGKLPPLVTAFVRALESARR